MSTSVIAAVLLSVGPVLALVCWRASRLPAGRLTLMLLGTQLAFPVQALSQPIAQALCVMSDSPMSLIKLDVLSRDLRDGCPKSVDVSGTRYGIETQPGHTRIGRIQDATWHRDLQRYLLSGDTLIISRKQAQWFGDQRRTVLSRGRVLARAGAVLMVRGDAGLDHRGDADRGRARTAARAAS